MSLIFVIINNDVKREDAVAIDRGTVSSWSSTEHAVDISTEKFNVGLVFNYQFDVLNTALETL
jgi:hypothetical protein